ncbi:MAG TPA: hypothetical protein VLL98_01395 [Rickettsiales bacterium]|nr:hypothetical protein [Rickettsiales bacterium]
MFIKDKFKKKKFKNTSKKPEIPNLHKEVEIKLDKEFYDFYTLQPNDERPFYKNSILFSIIKQHKNQILNNLVSILSNYDFKIKIGLEIEFYITNNSKNLNILRELKKILKNIENIETEKGQNQFEIKTKPYIDIVELVCEYQTILKEVNNFCISNNLNLNFDALPFDNDCGSALQINLSLVDFNKKNLFSRTKIENTLVDSDLMLNCVAGLLNNLNKNLLLYINDEKCLKRFDLEQNIKIKNLNKYPAPTFVSWGINNRTASIRIPTSSITNLEKYIEEDNKNRRIEFRIPSANADLTLTLIGVLSSLINGVENDLKPNVEKSAFDITINNENLERIENDINILNDIFEINIDILYI